MLNATQERTREPNIDLSEDGFLHQKRKNMDELLVLIVDYYLLHLSLRYAEHIKS